MTSFDIQSDMALFDGLETITFQSVTPDAGQMVQDSTVTALRRVQTRREMGFGGVTVDRRVQTFHIQDNTLSPNHRPKKRDRIIDAAGNTWIVEDVKHATWGTRYVCEVTQLPTNLGT